MAKPCWQKIFYHVSIPFYFWTEFSSCMVDNGFEERKMPGGLPDAVGRILVG